jgi:hypothetical protein
MRRLAAMRRASVAVALGLLLTVAACATAAPDGGHGPAAASRDHHRPPAAKDGSHVAALAPAPQAAPAAVSSRSGPGHQRGASPQR